MLGPQRPNQNLSEVLQRSVTEPGAIAVISAGWRHDEADIGPLQAAMGRPSHHLALYHWFDEIMRAHPGLKRSYRARQDARLAHKLLYRIRVDASLIAVRKLRALYDGDPDGVWPELQRAAKAVRRVDEDLMEELDTIKERFPELAAPWERPEVAPYLERIGSVVQDCAAIAIAGGHVAVLQNRLRFFGFDGLLTAWTRPIVAWSGGAMVLTDRIALYYDDPPEGPGEAEVLGPGLGLLPGVVLFPHAERRLRMEQTHRLSSLAIRFQPADCITLENGAHLVRRDDAWHNDGVAGSALRIRPNGTLETL